jgi:hypothetical protein
MKLCKNYSNGQSGNDESTENLDEIERLFFVFNMFYNEEKKSKNTEEKSGNKKVQMLPVHRSLNIYRDFLNDKPINQRANIFS